MKPNCLIFLLCLTSSAQGEFETLIEWQRLEFTEFDDYVVENNIIGNVRVYGDEAFVTVPRWRNGVPSTLNSLNLAHLNNVLSPPKLRPFPDLPSNRVGNCNALQNVAAIEIDPDSGNLWVMDSGTAAIFSRPSRKCPAKLVNIDLTTGGSAAANMEVVHIFPEEIVSKNSVIMHMVMDFSSKKPDDLWIYMSDIVQGRLIAYSLAKDESFAIISEEHMSATNTGIEIEGELVYLHFGVTGLALQQSSVLDDQEEERLFFGGLGSPLWSLSTNALKNSSNNKNISFEAHGPRLGSCEAMTADDQGYIYMGLLNIPEITKWNATSDEPISTDDETDVLLQKPELAWINSLWIHEGYLWIVNNRFHAYTWSTMDFDKGSPHSNFGLHRFKLDHGQRSYMHKYVSSSSSSMSSIIPFMIPFVILQKIIL